ncbi:efflux RND transporter periplasmic adaptor subunit [Halioglobus maricola]|uniref:Efflux RND transporter periplasmic adaptor subunit n=1 Tax=Halioglobus maricola TaxID=2601894 RepID=A0A5P9NHC8_9GAMM|nr:efflux RND transporter periplasmic adaptor subunit [Halioglobus maricola]QFU75230.1 efflux RND transporter periplasmic adaptor subunit [Halioglobus maricola]
MPKLVKNLLVPIAVVALAALIAYVMLNSRGDLPRRDRAVVAPHVDTLTVEPGPVSVQIHSRGIVTPQYTIELVSEVNGRVVWVDPGFLQGEEVSEGQVLLRVDPIDYEVAVSEARSAVATAELSLREATVLVQKASMAEAEARVAAAKERLRQAQVDLENTEIRAPFNAVVDIKRADLGQYVTMGTALMKLLSTDIAEVRLPILTSDIAFVRAGQNQAITLTASFGKQDLSWEASLTRVERRVDEETRVFYGVAQIENPYDVQLHDQILAHGLFVEAVFPGTAVEDAVRLPRSAVHNSAHVYLVENDQLVRRSVTVLRREGDAVVISDGLAYGDQVVLSRFDLMVEGMVVEAGE